MKKLILIMIAAGGTLHTIAQTTKSYLDDSQLSRWVIDLNLLGGLSNQNYTLPNSTGNYLNAVNANTGNLKYNNGLAYGGDAQLGFFFGKKRHFGIGAGYMYLMQQGDANMDNYHVEWQATDFKGSTYRTAVTGNHITENLKITNVNIPIVLKYKNRFSKHWGFTADAGILYNMQMKNDYTTHANFDYEALYQFGKVGDAINVPVYDNSPVPSLNDWMITKAEFFRNNPNGNAVDYFNAKSALGYNVGLNQAPVNTKGTVSYPTGTIGLLLQPSFNYFISDFVALNFGLYYLFQPFKTNTTNTYHLTDGVGTYSSVLNNVTKVDNQSYGLNLGVRFMFGKKSPKKMGVASIDPTQPSACGMSDGSIAIKGLRPNKPVTVDYVLNGDQHNSYSSTVQPDGQVKISNLSAGEYSGIVATVKKDKVTGNTITLTAPDMVTPTQIAANPTATSTCNGFVIFKGLPAGSNATVTYNLDGSAHAAYSGKVDADKLLTMNGLCEGKYTNVLVTCNKCSANMPDFILASPVVADANNNNNDIVKRKCVTTKTDIDVTTPILFDVNEYVIHKSDYPIIEEAFNELTDNIGAIVTIDGNADSTGEEAKNRPLSQNRANAVKAALVKRGISPDRIMTRGHGSRVPVATNRTYAGKQENRNATMSISIEKKTISAKKKD